MEKKDAKNEKLWNKCFFVLWQGQLVSSLGDALYSIALGFWVLAETGSTALMGTLMAASTLPGVIVSPFAGVFIDRYNKKRLLICMDFLRGIFIALIAAAAYRGLLAIWMVFVAGIVLSICGAVFAPGVESAVPDIVPKTKVTNANSVFSIVTAGSSMLGNVAGGFLYQIFSAPLLFLIDGLSFLFSGFSLPFVSIPNSSERQKQHFLKDMAEGFNYMWKQKGVRLILLIAAIINFFANIAIILFMPLFKFTKYLGTGRYGVAMGCFMAGAMAGYLFLSVRSIEKGKKFYLYILSNIIFDISIIIAVNQTLFGVMIVFLILTGFFNAVVNVLLIATVQEYTPQEVRGKVMAFMNMTTQGLAPFAMALGGVLGGFFPVRTVISVSFIIVFIVTIPSFFSNELKKFFINDTEVKKTVELVEK